MGNISYRATDEELREMFEQYGEVSSARIITDRETRRSKGFGFVEMSSEEAADKAIAELNGTDMQGRALRVNEARPRQ